MNNPYAAPEALLAEPVASDETYEPKIFSLQGRIGRLRYIAYSWLAVVLAGGLSLVLVGILSAVLQRGVNGILTWISYIPIYIASLIMAKRRMNDFDSSGWAALLILVPVLNAFLGLYLMFKAGTPGPNRFGPPPAKNSKGVVALAWLMPAIAIIGVVAAIAIPAYQQYVTRAKAAAEQQQNR